MDKKYTLYLSAKIAQSYDTLRSTWTLKEMSYTPALLYYLYAMCIFIYQLLQSIASFFKIYKHFPR